MEAPKFFSFSKFLKNWDFLPERKVKIYGIAGEMISNLFPFFPSFSLQKDVFIGHLPAGFEPDVSGQIRINLGWFDQTNGVRVLK